MRTHLLRAVFSIGLGLVWDWLRNYQFQIFLEFIEVPIIYSQSFFGFIAYPLMNIFTFSVDNGKTVLDQYAIYIRNVLISYFGELF